MFEVYGRNTINPPHIYQIFCKDNRICVALGNGHICLFDCSNSIQGVSSFEAHNERIMCCGWERSSSLIYTTSNNDIALWNESLIKRIMLDTKVNFI